MKNNKKKIVSIAIAVLIVIIGAVIIYFSFNKGNKDINELNEKLDEYYMGAFNDEMFVSQYSYLMKANGTEATIADMAEFTGYKLPKKFENVIIHFVKPKSLLEFPNVKIKKAESEIDLEVLTVFSAIPLEDGSFFISSKFDEGGILTSEEYQKFILKNSPIHGEIRNPEFTSEEYKTIKKAIGEYDEEALDGNVKYLACNDKYAMVVISSKNNSGLIKQFLLENKDGNWEVVMDKLEENEKARIFINTSYPDFDLSLLPKYNLALFQITSELDDIIAQLKEQNGIKQEEVLTYGCAAGKFIYTEFESGYKMLGHINEEGNFDIYGVDSYKTALQKMVELDSVNPPTFIINFEN
ncbi:MAG: hypothetical protein K2L15_01595 [Eubacteriales bacterium]|nr:hypothetical protein [Eubacteriales bacterium]